MNRDRIKRSISRIAYQIAEDNRDEAAILIVGIKKRGLAIADAFKKHLSSLSKNAVSLLALSETNSAELQFAREDADQLSEDYDYIILVDDVIFSGKTMQAAVQKTLTEFNPSVLRTAVLVDRGHRMLPVEATFRGLDLPTKLDEHVQVEVEDNIPTRVVLSKTGK